MATQADGLTSSVPDPLSEVLGCGLDSGDDRRQAQAYAVQAAKSAVQADADAKSAGNAAVRAESWAAGGTGTRTGEDADNAEYYAGQAKTSATAAAADRAAAETASQTAVSKAEAAAASAEAAAKSAIEAKPSAVATQSTNGLMSAADKTKLDGIAENANNYTHPGYTAQASGLYKVTVDSTGHVSAAAAVDKSDITALGIPESDTTYSAATTSAEGLMSAADKTKLDGVTAGANKYTHPSYTARASGLYKVTVDSTGHVSAVAAVDKSDITALGVPAQDTTYTHPSYTARASGLYKVTVDSTGHVSAVAAVDKSDITALGVPAQDTTYTHPSYTARASGLYKVTVDSTGHVSAAAAVDKSDITALGIPESDTTYSAATTSAEGLMSAADKTKLDGVTAGANKYTHPRYTERASGLYKVTVDSTGHVSAATAVAKSDITALGIPGSNTTYSNATQSAEGLMSAEDKTKLDGVTAGANKYTHPSYTARASRLYKVTVDSTGHVSAATAVTKSDITALGIPESDTTYSAATTSAEGLMSAADKTKLDRVAANANNYTHPSYTARASGLYKVTVDSTGHVSAATAVTKSDITALGIPIGEDHEITFSNIATGITVPNGGGKDKCYCYTVGKLGFLSITFESKYNSSGTAIAAGETLFYVEGVPKSIHTRYSSTDNYNGDFIAIRSSDGEQYILEATHDSTDALWIKAKEAIPAGYRYKINVVFVEV